MIDIRVLGTLAIHTPGGDAPAVALTQPKRFALLLYLALAEPAGPKSRDSLVALLWPEADDESARHSLRNALYGLRQTLGETAIGSRGEKNVDGYLSLDPTAIRCDALEVRRLLAEQRWEDAVTAWGGDLAPGFHVSDAPDFENWLDNQRTALRRAVTDAAWRRVDELEKAGDAGVVAAAQRACALEPANESGARRLMRFLDTWVGRAAALRAYDELVDYLRRECEAEPGAETRMLAEELKARTDSLDSSRPRELPAAQAPPTLGTVEVEAATTRSSSHRKGISATTAGIAGALLMVGLVSVFALRPAGSAAAHSGTAAPDSDDPVAMAEGRGLLRLPVRYRQDTSAYASYLRGLALRFSAPQSVSRDTFAALVNRKPLYAPGLSGLAHAYALGTVYGSIPPAEGWAKVEEAANKAIALDSTSASAYLALGMLEISWHWNVQRAGQLIDRGLALEPADPEAHALRSVWFRWQAKMDSAVAEARNSLELDPLNPYWSNRLARQLYLAERFPEAEAMYQKLIQNYPSWAPYGAASDVYLAMGRPKDALDLLRTEVEISGDSAALANFPRAKTDSQAERVFQDWARQSLRGLEDRKRAGEEIGPSEWANAYAGVRDKDNTLRWFDSMLVIHDPELHNVRVLPTYDFLRDDPRYRVWEANLPWVKKQ
jgi:DNA-binding SARP family transcriptional activator/tetratricopeptide (TPR) repeat protein